MSKPKDVNRIQRFAQWLKEQIKIAGYSSPRQFAIASDISDATIYRILQEKNLPDEETLKKISIAIKKPFGEVMLAAGYGGFVHSSACITFKDSDDMYNVIARSLSLPKEIRNYFISISEKRLKQLETNLGSKIKELRIKHDLSQEQFAKLFNIETRILDEIEQGKHPSPSDAFIGKIVQYFNISINELFGLRENNNTSPIVDIFPGAGAVSKERLIQKLESMLFPEEKESLALAFKLKNLSPEKRKAIEVLADSYEPPTNTKN